MITIIAKKLGGGLFRVPVFAFLLFIGCGGGGGSGGGGKNEGDGDSIVPAPTASISASAADIVEGESVVISWITANGEVQLTPPLVPNPAPAGSATASPAVTTTYTVVCTAPDKRSQTASVTVAVAPVIPEPTASISASAADIVEGESVVISWITANGEVQLTPPLVPNPAPAGSATASPAVTTTYTVVCTAPDKRSQTASVTVAVAPLDCAAPEFSYIEVLPERVLEPHTPATIVFMAAETADSVVFDDRSGSTLNFARIRDARWTISLDGLQLFKNYVDGEPQVFAGYIDTYLNSVRIKRYNLILPVRTEDMPDAAAEILAGDVQISEYVLNIRYDEQIFLGGQSSTYNSIKNAVIGRAENLLGEVDIFVLLGQVGAFANRTGGNIVAFPNLNFFDLANRGTVHEIGHCLGLAYSSQALLEDQTSGGHWALGNAADGIIGWSLPGGVGAIFPYHLEDSGDPATTKLLSVLPALEFNDLELYKMGVLDKETVAPVRQFVDQNQARMVLNNLASQPSCGTGCWLVEAPSEPVTIDQIIAADGPAVLAASTKLAVATIALSKNRLLTPNELAYIQYMAKRGESFAPVDVYEGLWHYTGLPFNLATQELLTISTKVNTK